MAFGPVDSEGSSGGGGGVTPISVTYSQGDVTNQAGTRDMDLHENQQTWTFQTAIKQSDSTAGVGRVTLTNTSPDTSVQYLVRILVQNCTVPGNFFETFQYGGAFTALAAGASVQITTWAALIALFSNGSDATIDGTTHQMTLTTANKYLLTTEIQLKR